MSGIDHFKFFKITNPISNNNKTVRLGINTLTVYEWGTQESGWRTTKGWVVSTAFIFKDNSILEKDTEIVWKKRKISEEIAKGLLNGN